MTDYQGANDVPLGDSEYQHAGIGAGVGGAAGALGALLLRKVLKKKWGTGTTAGIGGVLGALLGGGAGYHHGRQANLEHLRSNYRTEGPGLKPSDPGYSWAESLWNLDTLAPEDGAAEDTWPKRENQALHLRSRN